MKTRLILFFILSFSFAFAEKSSPIMKVETEIENRITTNLRNVISTQLSPESFTVGVRVQLSDRADDLEDEAKDVKPYGLGMGSVDVQNIIASYERELKEIKQSQNKENEFVVKKIEILVGISSSYEKSYQKKFEAWLKKYVGGAYGRVATTNLSLIQGPPKPNETPKDKEDSSPDAKKVDNSNTNKNEIANEKSFVQHLEDLQFLIGWVVFSIAVLASILLARLMTQKQTRKSSNESSLTTDQTLKGSGSQDGVKKGAGVPVSGKNKNSGSVESKPEEFETLRLRIQALVLELNTRSAVLINYWLKNDSEGFLKTAVFYEVVLKSRSGELVGEVAWLSSIKPLQKNFEVSIREAFRSLAAKTKEEKFRIYQNAYWDLLSYNTLGEEQFKVSFDFLKSIPSSMIARYVKENSGEKRSIVFHYLDSESKKSILSEMAAEQKESLILDLLKVPSATRIQIETIESEAKKWFELNKNSSAEQNIQFAAKVIEAVSMLKPYDELRIVRSRFAHPSLCKEFVSEYLTLAFLPFYKEEFKDFISKSATNEELLSLCLVDPSFRNSLIPFASPRAQAILEDELKRNPEVKDDTKNAHFVSVKQKLSAYLDKKSEKPGQMYDWTETNEGTVRAA